MIIQPPRGPSGPVAAPDLPGRRGRGGVQPPGRGRRLGPKTRRGIRIGLAALALLCGLLGGMVAYAALTLPSVDNIGKATGTVRLLDRNGQKVAEFSHTGDSRNTVPLSQIATVLQDATVSTEDRNFYNEGAFDVPRVLKALFVDVILRRPEQGASTITQQLAKNAFLQPDKSPIRKLREALLANQIAGKFSKQEILEKYLNIIPYGEGASGIENGSLRYFGVHAKDLTLRQASLLAGLPQAPSLYDPLQNPDAAFARQHVVLASMVAAGKLSQADADAVDPQAAGAAGTANRQEMANELSKGKPISGGQAPQFAQYVINQIDQQFPDDPNIAGGDLVVTTTLDLGKQQQAEQSVAKGVAGVGHGANNGALLMLDANSGDVMAMVGSADYTNTAIGGQFNITTALRRPGSSFKPYVYETGFKNGSIDPNTQLDDTRQESAALGNVQDFDRSYLGRISASRALLLSRNIPTEQAAVKIGVDNVISFAHSLGIGSDLAPNASTAIGSSPVQMTQHAAAYAAFANGGHRVQPRAILKIQDKDNNVLVDNTHAATLESVMSPKDAFSITRILRGYNRQWNVPIKYDVASKSGTTDDFVDAWYMSYTPDWVVATWCGHTSGDNPAEQPMDQVFGTTTGREIAAPFINALPQPSGFHDPGGGETSSSSSTPTPEPTPTPPPPPPTPGPATPVPTAPPSRSPVPSVPVPTLGV